MNEQTNVMSPKAFISYSWTSESHREMVRSCADRLLENGVGIVLDQYDLLEGDDKYAFMETMVNDPSVTHVLVFCDKAYAEKADARKAGVGTESQIISQELYQKVKQSTFIPIVCELSPNGEPYLPVFIKSRIWLDFSSPEAVNDNWEKLVRLLFGKPAHVKPPIGKPPSYIIEDKVTPRNPASIRFAELKQAFQHGKKGIAIYRNDFLETCFNYADSLRVRQPPDPEKLPSQILADCGTLVSIRDLLVDWVLLEGTTPNENGFPDALSGAMERLLELRSRPKEMTSWQEEWFEAHRLFVYEVFLYILAALLKVGAYAAIHDLVTQSYLLPETDGRPSKLVPFSAFLASSNLLNPLLTPNGQRLLSPAAALFKQQATRVDIPFESIMQADLLALICASLDPGVTWYPQTLFYAGYGKIFPFFYRATQHKHFQYLSIITGIGTAEDLRTKVQEGLQRMGAHEWRDFAFHANIRFMEAANIGNLDSKR